MDPDRSAIPDIGDQAPDVPMLDLSGRRIALSTAWETRPAILAFLRYFGCPFCKSYVGRLQGAASAIDERGAAAILVGQGSAGSAMAFTGPRRLRLDVLLDPERAAYRAFGLGAGDLGQLIGPAVAASWVRTHVRGEARQGGMQGGSFTQMPGTFIVDRAGIVRFAHRDRHAADDPSIAELLRALEALRG
jgi:peroxiredoxin